ncbi:MAG: hypothetical protein WCG04_04100 [Alphaproteobacteria bacterium]
MRKLNFTHAPVTGCLHLVEGSARFQCDQAPVLDDAGLMKHRIGLMIKSRCD